MQTVYVFSEDIVMEFGLKMCGVGVLVLKRGKVVKIDGTTLPGGQVMQQMHNLVLSNELIKVELPP